MDLAGLVFTKTALDSLATIPRKTRARVIKKTKALIDDYFPRGAKKLENSNAVNREPIYRVRSGDYRILYLVRSGLREVIVLDIGHRKNVYRNR